MILRRDKIVPSEPVQGTFLFRNEMPKVEAKRAKTATRKARTATKQPKAVQRDDTERNKRCECMVTIKRCLPNGTFAPLNEGKSTQEVYEYNNALKDEGGSLIGKELTFFTLAGGHPSWQPWIGVRWNGSSTLRGRTIISNNVLNLFLSNCCKGTASLPFRCTWQ